MNGRTWIKGVVHLCDYAEAWNVDGSASDFRCEEIGKSWIRFWEHLTSRRRSVCSYEDCNQQASCGGHVWIRKQGIHIVPICARCNNCNNECRMQSCDNIPLLRRGTLAVAITPTQDMIYAERRFVAVRSCQKCGADISDRPDNHILCFRCSVIAYQLNQQDAKEPARGAEWTSRIDPRTTHCASNASCAQIESSLFC